MSTGVPDCAEVVIVGGGIAGCSVAYHLAKLGISDVVLCERRQLTCGTTWHAAGLVTQLRATRNMTELAKFTCELSGAWSKKPVKPPASSRMAPFGWRRQRRDLEELKRGASMGRNFGLEVQVISPPEIKERWDPIDTDGIVGGLWLPNDGQVNPADVTMALAKGARAAGVAICENTSVSRLTVEQGKIAGVVTDKGDIRARKVVICAGNVVAGARGRRGCLVAASCRGAFLRGDRASQGSAP